MQSDLEIIVRNLKAKFPNIKISYLSTRSRAYTNTVTDLNPEPFAYETGFAVKWAIEDQIKGADNLNFDPAKGVVAAPLILWGPYIWADGLTARSDGFTWLCSDLESDFTHPSASGGVPKVADQLLAFFKTDPTATPWFLRRSFTGQPPAVTASASVSSGAAPLRVNFSASANDPDGTITSYQWTFDDGTFSTAQNPAKTFPAPGNYSVHLTVTDNSGNTVSQTIPISVVSSSLGNISTRLRVQTGNNALFGGFIITGSQPKRLMIRAIGPTVPVAGNLQNPTLQLFSGSTSIAVNDNWVDAANKQEIIDSGIAPKSDFESAILTSLAPGAYSAIVRGVNDTTGVGLVEVYDLDQGASSKLAQISTRGFVQTGDNVMFGGFFVSNGSQKVIIRAIGPSTGLSGALQDPTLELYDGNGTLMTSNDNWVDSPDKQAIIDSTVAPTSDFESAIVRTLAPGPYSAIVRGANSSVGIALVEVYALN
ncbi:MAG: PKD domain-containing protein [Verrucomicrobiota bacterium]|nr:PKD domain-containing protein [Verrucomicrobiota bacterium]